MDVGFPVHGDLFALLALRILVVAVRAEHALQIGCLGLLRLGRCGNELLVIEFETALGVGGSGRADGHGLGWRGSGKTRGLFLLSQYVNLPLCRPSGFRNALRFSGRMGNEPGC